MDRPGTEIQRAPMGFTAPPPVIEGEIEATDPDTGKWERVVVAEEKSGFVVKDKRKVK